MNRIQAYKILGLSPGCDEQEIRKRYKKLAMKVHPDLNPDPNAHEEFIRLSLAVECLLQPEIEQQMAARRASRSQTKTETDPSEAKSRMDEAKRRYEEQKKKNNEENLRYFSSLQSGKRWFIYRTIMVIGVVLSSAISLDALLPHHFEEDVFEGYSQMGHNGIQESKIYRVYFENTGSHFAESNAGAWLYGYPTVLIEKTWLLKSPLYFYTSDDFLSKKTNFDFDMISIRWILVPVLLVPLLPYFRRRMNIQYVFLYQFSFWFVGCVEIWLLFGNWRVFHLLTLGFL